MISISILQMHSFAGAFVLEVFSNFLTLFSAKLNGRKVVVKYFNFSYGECAATKVRQITHEASMTILAAQSGIGPQFHGLVAFNFCTAVKNKKASLGLVW